MSAVHEDDPVRLRNVVDRPVIAVIKRLAGFFLWALLILYRGNRTRHSFN